MADTVRTTDRTGEGGHRTGGRPRRFGPAAETRAGTARFRACTPIAGGGCRSFARFKQSPPDTAVAVASPDRDASRRRTAQVCATVRFRARALRRQPRRPRGVGTRAACTGDAGGRSGSRTPVAPGGSGTRSRGGDADVGALRHAESCPRCREELLRLTRVVTTARSAEAWDLPVAPPECVWQRISLEVLQETVGPPRPGEHPNHRSAGGKARVVRHRWTNRADGGLLGGALATAVLLLRRRRIRAGRATDR